MDNAAPPPELSASPIAAPVAAPVAVVIVDPTAGHMTMLAELAEINMVVGRSLRQRVEVTGDAGPDGEAMLHEVNLSVRRTVGLRQKLYDNSRKTPEEHHAERLCRIDAEVRARHRATRNFVMRALATVARAEAEERGAPEQAERLTSDLHDRLLEPDIARADSPEAVCAIILGLCKDAGITPRREIWSHALMRDRISETKAQLDEVVAAFPSAEEAARPLPPRPPPEPRVYPKIGPFTFGPTGAIIKTDVEPADWAKQYALRPEGGKPAPAAVEKDWAELIDDGRELPDFTKGRGPPKGG